MTDSDPQVVFRTQSTIEADVVSGLLETRGIDAVVSSGAPHAIFPHTVNGLGEVRLTVRGEQARRARRLIAEFGRQVTDRVTRIRDEFRAVEEALGYRFRDPGLLEHALTHRSRAHEDASGGVRDNESLEFLGDAVLGFVISDRLFRECPDWNEGQKSKARAVLVSTAGLARVGEQLGLGDHLLLGRGEERTGGRTKRSLIADTFEAVVAAVYLDGGVEAADRFVERWFRSGLDAVRAGEGLCRHDAGPTSRRCRNGCSRATAACRVTSWWARRDPPIAGSSRPRFGRREQALARGEGRSKKESEQRAAERALAALDGPPDAVP